ASWESLRIFAAVAESGSISGAARILNVTPSMVSKHIEELEARLETTLLTRGAQGTALTDTGQIVRDHVLTMQRSATAIERIASPADKKQEGRVTLSTSDGVAAWLARSAGEFLRLNPKISVAIDCGLWSKDPMADPADIAITVEEEK